MLSMFQEAAGAAVPAAAGSVTSTYNATVVRPASAFHTHQVVGCFAVEGRGSEAAAGWLGLGWGLAVREAWRPAVRKRCNQEVLSIGVWGYGSGRC